MVVEVISPSNKGLSWVRKIEEYRQHAKLAYLLLIESERPAATLITRVGDTWQSTDYDDREGTIALPDISCSLRLADIYKRISFEPAG